MEENGIESEEDIDKALQEFYRSYSLSNKDSFNKYTSEWSKSNLKLIYLSCRAQKSRAIKNVKDFVRPPGKSRHSSKSLRKL